MVYEAQLPVLDYHSIETHFNSHKNMKTHKNSRDTYISNVINTKYK